MKKMRIIDLLNLISKGKWGKLPKKFKHNAKIKGYDIFVWDDEIKDYVCVGDWEEPYLIGIHHLNDTITPLRTDNGGDKL